VARHHDAAKMGGTREEIGRKFADNARGRVAVVIQHPAGATSKAAVDGKIGVFCRRRGATKAQPRLCATRTPPGVRFNVSDEAAQTHAGPIWIFPICLLKRAVRRGKNDLLKAGPAQ